MAELGLTDQPTPVVKPKYQLSEKRKQQMRDYSKLDRQFKVLTDPDFLVNQRKKSAATRKSIHDLPPEEQKRVRQMKKDSRERCIERQEREKRERAENSSDEEEIGVPQTKRARQIKKASRGGCKEKKKMEKRDMAENSSDEEEIGIPKKRLRQVKRVNYAEYSGTESSGSEEIDIEAELQYHRSRYLMFKRSSQKKSSQRMEENQVRLNETVVAEENEVPEKGMMDSGSAEDEDQVTPSRLNVCVSSLLGASFRGANDVPTSHTRPDRYDQREPQPTDSNWDFCASDYKLGDVSETEIIYIESDSEPLPDTTRPEIETSDANLDVKPNLPIKPEVIVIQPDSDLDSDRADVDIKMETDNNPSMGKDSVASNVACSDRQKNNCDCMCKLVSLFLRNAKVTCKTVGKKTIISCAKTDKTVKNDGVPYKEVVEPTETVTTTMETMIKSENEGTSSQTNATAPVQSPEAGKMNMEPMLITETPCQENETAPVAVPLRTTETAKSTMETTSENEETSSQETDTGPCQSTGTQEPVPVAKKDVKAWSFFRDYCILL